METVSMQTARSLSDILPLKFLRNRFTVRPEDANYSCIINARLLGHHNFVILYIWVRLPGTLKT